MLLIFYLFLVVVVLTGQVFFIFTIVLEQNTNNH